MLNRTSGCTRWPRSTSAAARKSSSRPAAVAAQLGPLHGRARDLRHRLDVAHRRRARHLRLHLAHVEPQHLRRLASPSPRASSPAAPPGSVRTNASVTSSGSTKLHLAPRSTHSSGNSQRSQKRQSLMYGPANSTAA